MRLWVTIKYYRKMRSIKPYDLGGIVENTQGVRIDDLVSKAKEQYKQELIKSTFNINGLDIQLTTSKTRFGGNRIWFICPICKNKKGVIYTDPLLGCRVCLNLKYKKQRYKNMIENTL